MTSEYRVGLVGYGGGGRVFHAPLIAATPGLQLTSVVTTDPARRAQLAADHPGTAVLDSIDDLLEGGIDLVVISTANRTHAELALTAIAAGVPVVVDKPFAASVADAQRVVVAAEDRGVALTVFQNRRWDGDFLTVRRLVEQGRLGRVHRFESRFERWLPQLRNRWRESPAPQDAGGLLYDLGAHLIDQAIVLFGPVAATYAELDTRRPGAQIADDVFVSLRHDNGCRSHLWASALVAKNGPRFRVLGDQAGYVKYGMDPQEDALISGQRPGDPGWGEDPDIEWGSLGIGAGTEPIETEHGAYECFYAAVAAALQDGTPMPVEPASSVYALQIIEAALESSHTRKTVTPQRPQDHFA